MAKERYTLVRVHYESTDFGSRLTTEEIWCKTKQEAVDLASILTIEEKIFSYIFDNVTGKRLTLKGEY